MAENGSLTIRRVGREEYAEQFPDPSHAFLSTKFNDLNRHKCEDIHYLLFENEDGKVRGGIILGEKPGMFRSPFSAPFGGIEERRSQKLQYLIEAARCLDRYGKECGKDVVITFPPAPYDCGDSRFSRQALTAMAEGAEVMFTDFNYHIRISDFPHLREMMGSKARGKLSASERNGLTFERIKEPSKGELEAIYDIIHRNHTAHGYPVHLTLDEVIATSKVVKMDFYMVRDRDGKGVASAICYRTSVEVSQSIYWGDIPEGRNLRPMNFLAYNIIRDLWERSTAGDKALKYFDLGPASSDGIPALGLCDFKESLGAILTPKYTLRISNLK